MKPAMQIMLDRDVVLAAFSEDPNRILKIKELGLHIGIPHTERANLRQLVRALLDAGDLIAHPGRRFSLASEGTLVEGRIQRHHRGFAWLLPDEGGMRDAFLPPEEAAGLLDGDRVLCRISPTQRGPLGKVIKILARSTRTLTGTLRTQQNAIWVDLEDPGHPSLLIPSGEEGGAEGLQDGAVVEVHIVRYPTAVTSAVGRVIRFLGQEGDISVEVERLIAEGNIVRPFSPEALSEASVLPAEPSAADMKGRLDLTALPLCTIDGATAKDFDDAVYAEPAEDGAIRIIVAIADVAHYVPLGSALDTDAVARATSVYYPGQCIPMLPEALSNGLCSLNPHVPRLCMVCEMTLTKNGRSTQVKLHNGVLNSQARLTYEDVHAYFTNDGASEGDKAQRESIPVGVQRSLETLREAALRLRKRRQKRGSMDFDLPESHVVTGEDGEPIAIASTERRESHRLIEDLMIAANEAVATHLESHDQPCVFRIHEPPNPEKLDAFLRLARTVEPGLKQAKGARDKASKGPLGNKELSQMLASLAGHRLKTALDFLMLRAMMQARYSAFNVGHFGLGSEAYAHFTSPIRRYPDLIVHRLVKEHLKKPRRRLKPEQLDDENEKLEGLAAQCSELERNAMGVERKVDALYAAWFMKDRLGEIFQGTVSGCAEFAVFVRLDDPEVEGSVHVTALGGDFWRYDELRMRLSGERTGFSVGVGDRVEVQIAKVDLAHRRIELVLLAMTEREGHPCDDKPPEARGDGPSHRRGARAKPTAPKNDASERNVPPAGFAARARRHAENKEPGAAKAGRKKSRSRGRSGGSKSGDAKSGDAKSGGTKGDGAKSGGSKSGGAKSGGAKSGGSKSGGKRTSKRRGGKGKRGGRS